MSNIAVRNGVRAIPIKCVEVSELENEAVFKAVRDLRPPDSKVTHVLFCSPSRRDIPSPDYHLTRLLDVRPSVQHFQYTRGYFDLHTVISVFRNFSNQNRSGYVLLVCSEFRFERGGGSQHRRQEARVVDKVVDLETRLKVREAELARVRKKEYEAQVRAEKAEAELRHAKNKLAEIAIITGRRPSRT